MYVFVVTSFLDVYFLSYSYILQLSFAWTVFIHPLTSILSLFLYVNYVTCSQDIVGVWEFLLLLIHSANPCLFIGVFNRFVGSVITKLGFTRVMLLHMFYMSCPSSSALSLLPFCVKYEILVYCFNFLGFLLLYFLSYHGGCLED